MLNPQAVKAVAKALAELWIGIFAMQGIFYYVWVPLDWRSLLLVGLILSIGQAIRAVRGQRNTAAVSSP